MVHQPRQHEQRTRAISERRCPCLNISGCVGSVLVRNGAVETKSSPFHQRKVENSGRSSRKVDHEGRGSWLHNIMPVPICGGLAVAARAPERQHEGQQVGRAAVSNGQ